MPASRPSESPKGVGSGRCTMVHFPVAFAQKPSFRCRLLSGPKAHVGFVPQIASASRSGCSRVHANA